MKTSRFLLLIFCTIQSAFVFSQPVPLFTSSDKVVCAGSTISFTDKSENNPSAWHWVVLDENNNDLIDTTAQNFSFKFITPGQYTIKLIVSNTAGIDSLIVKNYISILSDIATILPFTEDFEGTTVLTNWMIYNPNADVKFAFTDRVSANGNGTWAMFFNNYSTTVNLAGTVDALFSSKINFALNQNEYLNFDVAYARFSKKFADTLVLLYSTNCGKTFTEFWRKAGSDLATAPDDTSLFIPTNSEWRKEKISLLFLNGKTDVHIAIMNRSGWGNAVYLDNIQFLVPNPTEVSAADFSKGIFKIYPNPGSGIFSIESNYESTFIEIEDLTGKTRYTSSISADGTTTVDLSGLSKGLYIVKFKSENNTGQSKLLIE